jgi:hypothetical protein
MLFLEAFQHFVDLLVKIGILKKFLVESVNFSHRQIVQQC